MLGIFVAEAFLFFFEIIVVFSAVAIEIPVFDFQNVVANLIQEMAIMGYHQQGNIGVGEIRFHPFNHLNIKVIGGFIENKQVGVGNEGAGKRCLFALAARQLAHRFEDVLNPETGKHLFGTALEIPRLKPIHLLDGTVQASLHLRIRGAALMQVVGKGHARLILFYRLNRWRLRIEDGIQNRCIVRKIVYLRKIRDSDILTDNHLTCIRRLHAGNDVQKCGLPRAVFGNQRRLLSLFQSKRDILKQQFLAVRLCYAFDCQVVH